MGLNVAEQLEIKQLSQQAIFAAKIAEAFLNQDNLISEYQGVIRKAAEVVAPLIEEAADWGLTCHMKQMKRVISEFSVSPMEAAQILALRKSNNNPTIDLSKAVAAGVQEMKKRKQ